jgi:ribosomal protein S18 acetylase RimI-like enzyme
MDMEEYKVTERDLTVEEYQRMRGSTYWFKVSDESVRIGMSRSLYSVCVTYNGELIGCGRVVGDGGIYFYLQDIIVWPGHQRKGVGRLIMKHIMNYLKQSARPGDFIGLMAAKGVSKFYERYGFAERAPDVPGMSMLWKGT